MIIHTTPRYPALLLKSPISSPGEDRGVRQRLTQSADDSYTRQAAEAAVIDAEYVDSYAQAPLAASAPPPAQDAAALLLDASGEISYERSTASIGPYRAAPQEVPRPGRLINVYA